MTDFEADILAGLGLTLTLLGAWITGKSVILKEDDAIKVGLTRFVSDKREENLKLPMVQNLLASSKGARRGLLIIAWGTALQLVPIAFRLVSQLL